MRIFPKRVMRLLIDFNFISEYDNNYSQSWCLQYYKYVLETPFALTGTHNLAKATAKGDTVVLFVASANDKQWQSSQKALKAMLDSFQV